MSVVVVLELVLVLEELPVEPLLELLEPLEPELPLDDELPLLEPFPDVLPVLLDVLLEELLSLSLSRESSVVDDESGESRNTTERRSVSNRRNKARAICERSISTWPSADDDQCICNADRKSVV